MDTESLALLSAGYVRQIEELSDNLKHVMPMEIVDIILSHLVSLMGFAKFAWNQDPSAHGDTLEFIDDNTVVHAPHDKHAQCWCIFTASNVLCKMGKYSKFKWEVMIKETETDNTPYMNGRIGFMSYPVHESNEVWNSTNLAELMRDKQTAIKLFVDCDSLDLYNYELNGAVIRLPADSPIQMKHKFEDRYALLFDFEARTVSAYYNDCFVAVIHAKLPEKVVPAMSFYTHMDKKAMAVCTKWEIVA